MSATPPTMISGMTVHTELGDHDMPRHTMTQELGELLHIGGTVDLLKKTGGTINIKNLDRRATKENYSQQPLNRLYRVYANKIQDLTSAKKSLFIMYRRSGFNCEYLLNANCEFFYVSQLLDSQT